ncbi:uncharacterized protein LOC144919314 [Branchiostoma floridae x Branchiostoma belcheri]
MTMPSVAIVLCLLGLAGTGCLAAPKAGSSVQKKTKDDVDSIQTLEKIMDEKIEEITGTVKKLGKQMDDMNDKIEDLEKRADEDSSEEKGPPRRRPPNPKKKFKESNGTMEGPPRRRGDGGRERGGWGRGWSKDGPKSSEETDDSSEERSSEESKEKRRKHPPKRSWWSRKGEDDSEDGVSDGGLGNFLGRLMNFRRGGWGQNRFSGRQGGGDERGQDRGHMGGGWGGWSRKKGSMRGRDEESDQNGRDFWRG